MIKPKVFFVTATGTDVGKTFISCGLAALWHQQGHNVGVMKPFASGAQKKSAGRWISQDAQLLMRACASSDSMDLVNPYCFKAPLAPWMAAQQENQPVQMSRVLRAYRKLVSCHDILLVEGAGGILVPLAPGWDVLRLMRHLDAACIVVTSAKLGTLNHTFLTLQALRQNNIFCQGIILNDFNAQALADRTNLEYFKVQKVTVLATVPRRQNWSVAGLAQHLWQHAGVQSLTKKG